MEAIKSREQKRKTGMFIPQSQDLPSENDTDLEQAELFTDASPSPESSDEIPNPESEISSSYEESNIPTDDANNSTVVGSSEDPLTENTSSLQRSFGPRAAHSSGPIYNQIGVKLNLLGLVGINLYVDEWGEMCSFYEETLELRKINNSSPNVVGFACGPILLTLVKNETKLYSTPQDRMQVVFLTEMPLSALFQKLTSKGIEVVQTTLDYTQNPLLQTRDPDGNIICFFSNKEKWQP
jgi:hypothetical protein